MSLDLLEEFGGPSHHDSLNPWASSTSYNGTKDESIGEDDFGDFAQPETSFELVKNPEHAHQHGEYPTTIPQDPGGLLIDTETTKPPPSPSPSFRELNASLKLAIPEKVSIENTVDKTPEDSTPITAWPSFGRDRAKSMGKPIPMSPYTEDDDDWGDFQKESETGNIDHEASLERHPTAYVATTKETKQDTSLLDLMDSPQAKSSPPTLANPAATASDLVTTTTTSELSDGITAGPAPSNIPPPSVLLSVIATLLYRLPDEIRGMVSSMSISLMNGTIPADESFYENLHNELAKTTASARILAGRKLRWKRDTHLAQRMSIGPANAGKAGGMKLTGVDRNEARREDQEAAEVVKLWQQQAGGIKSQIAKVNAQQSEVKFAIPEYSANMPIRVAKLGEGGLTAPKCCFLCGLKRDERVARLDVNVEDSFGEWWIDHWGHTDCIRFWEEHKDSLK
ncbi:MAG: hypothetical protein Q9176_001609 [Flavoplaca citrina]